MRCPKCGFEQAEGSSECLRCGVVFARLARRRAEAESSVPEAEPDLPEEGPPAGDDRGRETLYEPPPPELASQLPGAGAGTSPPAPAGLPASRLAWRSRAFWRELLLEQEKVADPFRLGARAVLAAILLLWGWRFLSSSVADNYVGESFLHWINLPFHEAGHVFFGFFGDFIRALGGTLGQLLIPTICLVAFLRRRDPFAASAALWWLAENFMDIGPYIADARAGELTLLGGVTARDVPGYHDWENILIDLDLMQYDQVLGGMAYAFGRLLMLASFVWGGTLLVREWRELRKR